MPASGGAGGTYRHLSGAGGGSHRQLSAPVFVCIRKGRGGVEVPQLGEKLLVRIGLDRFGSVRICSGRLSGAIPREAGGGAERGGGGSGSRTRTRTTTRTSGDSFLADTPPLR